jgi:hypothetical protein
MEELIEWVRTYPGQTGKSLVIAKATELLQKEKSQMYSEEDLREAFRQGMDNMEYSSLYGWSSTLTEQEWFEQYKKK